ncbi:SDR family oxidoreductase [Azoarcus sp. L1K30]|uniref:NAD-dependent epimerase/dehydratase family protein n=1 Tax=Azoarcus sp. L1K30 TaxID=2820277 RepID=UPI001B82AA4D|nr:SDR family oxidoreductase [Azoarcus sp. L1K30]MBR0567228.1 SDR family oxidoreductase [Azoarcus sp. L1K30]
MASVWVTGHRGYLGECVVRCAADRGWRIVTTEGRLQDLPAASVVADAVIHCAGALRHRGDAGQHASHVDGTLGMLGALTGSVPIVYASSRSVYGAHVGDRIPDGAACRPVDAYGRAKLDAEQSIAMSGSTFTLLRLSVLIGAGVSRDGEAFLRTALHTARAGGAVSRFCPDRAHDALGVWTAARACVAALEAGPSCRIYNLPGPARSMHASLAALMLVVPQGTLVDSWAGTAPIPVLDSSDWVRDFGAIDQLDDMKLFAAWVQWLEAGGQSGLPEVDRFPFGRN